MYGKQVNQAPVSEVSYLSEGIHENVFIKSATLGSWSGGECIDITLSDPSGNIVNDRIFPFNYSGGKLNKTVDGKSVALTEEEELESYLLRFKHIFSAAVGEENYDKAIVKATDFKSFAQILGKMSKANYAASKSFRVMLISKLSKKDGKYYTVIPNWSNGFVEAEGVSPKIKFNVEKYGKKTLDSTKVEQPANTPAKSDDLPF